MTEHESKAHILATAMAVFAEKGFARASINDVVRASGLSKGGVYWHFKNKGDLFNAMCDRVSLPLETMTEAAAAADVEDPLGELRKSVQFFFHKVTHDEHYRLVFDILFSKCEFVAELGPIVERDARVREQFMHRFERTFGNAEKRGQLPKGLNHRLAVHCYQGLVKGIVRNWLLDPNSFDLEADGSRMLEAFFEMLQVSTALRDQSVGKGSKKK